MSDYKIGEGVVKRLIVRSNVKPGANRNIAKLTTELQIFEDVFANHMSAEISILDASSILTELPIVGGEIVEMDVSELGNSPKIRSLKSNFVAVKLSSRQRPKPDMEFYVLSLSTKEQTIDSSGDISRSYYKPIHEIVKDVVTEFLTPVSGKKLVSFEETKGIHSIIATGITPMAFIKQLIREAESLNYSSSIFFFYETMEGYHFHTLDGLYSKEISHKFVYDEITKSQGSADSGNLQYNISYLNIDNSFNLLDGQIDGQFAAETSSFDPLTKTFQSTTYTYDKFVQSRGINKTIPNTVVSAFMGAPTISRYIATNSHRKDVEYITSNDPDTAQVFRRRQDFMDLEKAVMTQYLSTKLHASIPGNSNVIAGQTIELIIPSPDDSVAGKMLNEKFISGKYIVTAVSHNLDVTTNKYATVMECMRPGFEGRIVK